MARFNVTVTRQQLQCLRLCVSIAVNVTQAPTHKQLRY